MIWCTLRVFLYFLRGAFYCTYSYIYRCINIGIHATAWVGVLVSFPSCKAVVSILMQVVACFAWHARYVKHGNAYGLYKLCINKIHLTSVNPYASPLFDPRQLKIIFHFYTVCHLSYDTPHLSHDNWLLPHILCPDTYPHNTTKPQSRPSGTH